MAQLSVVIYGDTIPAQGGWCYAEAFRELGCQVTTVSEATGLEGYSSRLALRAYRRVFHKYRERDRSAHVNHLINITRKCAADIVIVLKGLLIGPEDVRLMQSEGAWVVNVNHDDYFSSYSSNWSTIQRAALPVYDYLLATRQINVEELRSINPRVAYFPFAYHPPIHRPVPIPPEEVAQWEVDVVFIGTYAKHRASLLEKLVRAVPVRYAIYGSGWNKLPRKSAIRPFVKNRALYFDSFAKAIGGAKISLSFLRKENRDEYTQRTFEIPACGGALLTERTATHQSLFEEGVEVELFAADNAQELIDKCNKLLTVTGYLESMKCAGKIRINDIAYTYKGRSLELLNTYRREMSTPREPQTATNRILPRYMIRE